MGIISAKAIRTILVATNQLQSVGGSETFTYTLIEELKERREFDVEYFTFEKGLISSKIELELKIPFMSKNKYDLIFANHNRVVNHLYGKGFILQTCHGIFPKLEQPSYKSDAFVSISQEVQSHLANLGFSSKIILNGINLNRFRPLRNVSDELKSVLSLCHSKAANNMIKKICDQNKIKYLEAFKYNDPRWSIEKIINEADMVIGLGRSAYEAMACGRPVIVYDDRDYFESYGDGYVKPILGLSLMHNCSGRYSKNKYDESTLELEFLKYSSKDFAFFRKFAIRELDIKKNVDFYFEYIDNILEFKKKARQRKRIDVHEKIGIQKVTKLFKRIAKRVRRYYSNIVK